MTDCISKYHPRKFMAVAVLRSVRRTDVTRVAAEGPHCYDHIVNELRYWPERWDVTPLAASDEAAEQQDAAQQAIEQALIYRVASNEREVASVAPYEYTAPSNDNGSPKEDTMATETTTKTRGPRSAKFPVGTSLTATHKGKTFKADVKETADGGRTFVITKGGHAEGGEKVKAGDEFTSPSGAGKKITGHAVNGYVFWAVDGADDGADEKQATEPTPISDAAKTEG